tara:strand:- start:3767 stop:4069 length:303 start_codon:yes stop_codon:yes gene_type:complete
MKKLLLNILFFIFLTGCFQSTAMVGPGITLVSSGNYPQAFGAFFTNKAVKEETGMETHEYLAKKVEEQRAKKQDKRINQQLLIMLESNIKKTQQKIIELN